jgi:hypothetical protein
MSEPAFTVVTWDNIGNTLWGVRLSDVGDQWTLLPDDPAALDSAPTFDELFADYDVTLHECKTLEAVDSHIADADFLVVHKEYLPGDVLRKGTRLRLIQHLGLDYRGIPMDAARAMGVPVAATPLVNYLAVAEHNWALILDYFKRMPQHRRFMQERTYVQEGWGAVPGLKIILACDQTLGRDGRNCPPDGALRQGVRHEGDLLGHPALRRCGSPVWRSVRLLGRPVEPIRCNKRADSHQAGDA